MGGVNDINGQQGGLTGFAKRKEELMAKRDSLNVLIFGKAADFDIQKAQSRIDSIGVQLTNMNKQNNSPASGQKPSFDNP